MNSHLLHNNTLIIQLKQITYIGNFTQKYLTRKSILYSFLLVFTQNYSKLVFFGNLILDSLDTRFMKATRVRVSTSVKKEVLMIEYWSEWVLSDHTSVYNFGGSIRLKSEFGIFYSSHGRLYRWTENSFQFFLYLKPVEISNKCFNIIWTSLKVI